MLNTLFSDPIFMAVAILFLVVLILLGIVISMHSKMKKFLINVDSKNITESLSFISTNLKELELFKTEMEEYLTGVENRLRKSVQAVHTVRFNPFQGTGGGGNQSFATAFLNEDGDGVIISSLYSREHVSVFSKPIINNSSPHELSDEEKEALTNANLKLKQKK